MLSDMTMCLSETCKLKCTRRHVSGQSDQFNRQSYADFSFSMDGDHCPYRIPAEEEYPIPEPFVRYRHFHIPDVNNIPSVTLRAEQDRLNPTVWFMAWAICRDIDQFNRKIGRNIVDGIAEKAGDDPYLVMEGECPIWTAVEVIMDGTLHRKNNRLACVREAMPYHIPENNPLSPYYKKRHDLLDVIVECAEITERVALHWGVNSAR